MAAQVSLPSMISSAMRRAGARRLFLAGDRHRPRTRRDPLGRDAQKQLGILETIDGLVLGNRLLDEFLVAVRVQALGAARGLDGPVGKVGMRQIGRASCR